MTCGRIALILGALGVLAIGAIFTFDGVTVSRRRFRYRSVRWRLCWWASWLSFLLGIALWVFVCESSAATFAPRSRGAHERVAVRRR